MSKSKQNIKLERNISLWVFICLGVGATVGSGIFSTITEVADAASCGLFLVLAFVIGGLLQIPGSFCYAELASAYPVDGAHYIYFKKAGFKALTFISGWLTVLCIDAPGVAVMVMAIANYLSFFFNCDIIFLKIAGCFVVVLAAFLHIKDVKFGGIIQAIMTIIKIIPFVVIVICGISSFDPDLFMSSIDYTGNQMSFSDPDALYALFAATSLSLFSFDGIFCGCYVSGEVKNPKKLIPIGLILTALLVIVLYTCLSGSATSLMPINKIAESKAPIADMAVYTPVIGEYASSAVAAIAILVVSGTIFSCLMFMPRYVYAMAKDGSFFNVFSKIHPKYKSPYMAIILFAAYVIVLSMCFDIRQILDSLIFVLLLKNTMTYALIFILSKKPDYNPSYKCPCGFLMPIISVVSTGSILIFELYRSSITGILPSLIVIVISIVAYNIWRIHKH